ncbi:MAG: TonB-dependent receptor [Gammaproteobacteria bacterium]|nr:MAG: TonB-dependent receptor [Gammaproteobacteria bacterium]TLY87948.1 MAG: TonB-dependent receptor [Gammaproteobacteria bacterium]
MLVRRYASLTARLPASEATTLRARVCASQELEPMSTGLGARRVLVSALILSNVLPAWAAGGAPGGDAEPLQLVVVSATRIPTPQLDLASSVTVVTAEDIAAQQQRTIADVLRNIPGLNLVQQGGPGSVTSVFMRGTSSNHTKVLIDGIDVSDPSNANAAFDFGQLLTQDIERIEVLRGPQSGLYGSDAIGGVINVITRSGSGPMKLAASIEGGSFDSFNQTAGLSGSQDTFRYSANVAHLHSGATPVTPPDLLGPGEPRHDDYYDNFTVSTKLGLEVAPSFDLGLVARYTSTHLHYTGEDFSTFPALPAAQQSESNTDEYYGRATAHLVSLAGALDQTLGAAFMRNQTATLQPQTPEGLNTGERVKVDWQGAVRLAAAETLLLGLEDARDEISQPLSASTRIDSGYAELQSQLGEHWFSALNVRYDDNDRFGSKVTYRVAPAWVSQASGTKLKASVGSGFKAPTLSELFQDFPQFLFFANPNLRPESSVGYDAGIEQDLAGNRLRVGATWYHNRIRDLITTDVTATTWANVGRATTYGVESFIAWQAARQLALRLDYTYTEASDELAHQELLRRPKHKGTLNVSWRPREALLLDLSVLSVSTWVDGNRDFSIPRLDAPGYTAVNLAAAFDLTRTFTVFGRLDNLLDRRYENPVGFLQPRFRAFAGVRAKL